MSIVSNIIYPIADIHCCFASNTINCCATCFAQTKCFWYNVTTQWSLGHPPSCNEIVIYLCTLEKTLQNRPSWTRKFFAAENKRA